MIDWAKTVVNGLGYIGLTVLMFLENVFPPIPSEIIMPLGGFLTTTQELTFTGVVLAGTLGSVLGALPLYYLGHHFDEKHLQTLADRYGGWCLMTSTDIKQASDWFHRHGSMAVFLGRVVPGVRSLVSIPAGSCHMPIGKFLLLTAAGAGIWTTFLAYAGRLLGEHYEQINEYIQPISYLVGILLFSGFIWWLHKKYKTNTHKL
ncbi:MAG: alkaline phosphatase [Nitrospirales bacterium]|nr:MAG: alkaline phosphatase [Nitrospirales bacterium]